MPAYSCPYCKKVFDVAAGITASRVRCPHCQRVVEVPKKPSPRWFFARNKKKYGPYNWQQLVGLARRGEVRPEDQVLQVGGTQWVRADSLPGLFAAPAQAPPKATIAPPLQAPRPERRRFGWVLGAIGGALIGLLAAVAIVGYFMFVDPTPPDRPTDAKDNVANADSKKDDKVETPVADSKKPIAPRKDDNKSTDSKPADAKPTDGKDAGKKPKQPNRAEWTEVFLARLNRDRKSAGLGAVTLDADLSQACQAHARYLAIHIDPRKADAASVLDEDPGKKGFSIEGQRAAQVGLVSFREPLDALEHWMGRLLNRVGLLNPETRSLGLGFEQNEQGDWFCVVDPVRGRGAPIVVYPAPKQSGVPLSFAGGPEAPDKVAAGYPITVSFPHNVKAKDTMLDVRDAKGKPLDGFRFTPEKSLRPDDQRNSIALIPNALLERSTTYHAKTSAVVDGKPWSLAWSFTTEDATDADGAWAKMALAKVNAYRQRAGLKPVALDAALCGPCLAHARYLVINEGHEKLQGLLAHQEFPGLPGYSAEGDKAGRASDIGIGDYEPIDAVDSWMATLYHRVPILEPNLKTVGFGCARGRRQGWVTVLDVNSGRERAPRPHAVYCPSPDETNVPLSFPNGGETPNPIPDDEDGRAGYPVTASFPDGEAPTSASGKLTDDKGAEVRCWFSSAAKPANPMHAKLQGNTICLIPEDPLLPSRTYHVHLQGMVAGKAWEKRWKFTTGSGAVTIEDAARRVVDRLNECRTRAGLATVAMDEKLARGCQLHAEYLVKNADVLRKKNSPVNDEDPLLPGFTAEGLQAARQSLVFTNAPVPVMQIDDLMATFANRVYLLDPGINRIGFGCAHDVGRGWRCVLDINGGGGERVVTFPAPGQDNVPVVGYDQVEGAKPGPGFPIGVTFPRQAKLRNAQAVLSKADGKDVAVHVSSPQTPIDAKLQRSTIGIHPLRPLEPVTTYSITVSVIVDGSEWRQAWQFTTTSK
jgi:uncharacterized protein YkwD